MQNLLSKKERGFKILKMEGSKFKKYKFTKYFENEVLRKR
jgi:hypothetical protein